MEMHIIWAHSIAHMEMLFVTIQLTTGYWDAMVLIILNN